MAGCEDKMDKQTISFNFRGIADADLTYVLGGERDHIVSHTTRYIERILEETDTACANGILLF